MTPVIAIANLMEIFKSRVTNTYDHINIIVPSLPINSLRISLKEGHFEI